MKKYMNFSGLWTTALAVCLIVLSCRSKAKQSDAVKTALAMPGSNITGGQAISIEQANTMIAAYLRSSDSGATKSLFMSADTLRHYLNNPKIVALKFFLARKPATSPANGDASDSSGQLSLVIAGIDSQYRYVTTESGGVYDELNPCPTECPPGDAGKDLLP